MIEGEGEPRKEGRVQAASSLRSGSGSGRSWISVWNARALEGVRVSSLLRQPPSHREGAQGVHYRWEFPVELNEEEDEILAMNERRGVGKSGWLGPREFNQNRYPKLWRSFEHYFPDGLINSDGEPVTDILEECVSREIHGKACHSTWVECPDREHYCYLMDRLPVYRLLDGPTRPTVPAYASMLGSSIDLAQAAVKAEAMKSEGYAAQKWFFRYGPGNGQEGLEKNLAMTFAVREAVGPHYPIAFDAFNGWTEPYAVEMLRKLEPINPLWVEEVLRKLQSVKQVLLKNMLVPEQGLLLLPQQPGLGLVIDEKKN